MKCSSPPNNTHILGGCRFSSKLIIKIHNNTSMLLYQMLQTSDGGRWPIVGIDLGNNPTTNFNNKKIDMHDTASAHLP
jgi:hypothetical protein